MALSRALRIRQGTSADRCRRPSGLEPMRTEPWRRDEYTASRPLRLRLCLGPSTPCPASPAAPYELDPRRRPVTTDTGGIVWRPTPEVAEARADRELHARPRHRVPRRAAAPLVADPEWYWDAVVRHLGVRWTTPYTRVLDGSRGLPWPTWFPGGRLNLADNCVDRHVEAGRGARPAIVWEGDDGQSRTLSYAELAQRGQPPGQRAEGARRGRRRPGRRLPADVAGGRHRHAGRREDRRHLHAVLLGLRRRRRRLAAGRLRGQALDHGGRLLPARPGREDEGDGRRGRGPVPVGDGRPRLPAARPRHPVDGRARSLVARRGGRTERPGSGATRSRPTGRASSSTRRARPAAPRARCSLTAAS